MSNIKARQKDSEKIRGLAKTTDIVYNDQAGANKSMGLIMGVLTPKGTINASTGLPGKEAPLISLFNNSNVVDWVITSDAAIGAAPTSANGIAIPPYCYITIAVPYGHSFIRAGTANVLMYLVEDDSYIS